jgi:hypothetical protein
MINFEEVVLKIKESPEVKQLRQKMDDNLYLFNTMKNSPTRSSFWHQYQESLQKIQDICDKEHAKNKRFP